MKLTQLSIRNFRAISELTLDDLPNAVVLAGPNGCGKSCVLDAIRLLKSVYGGYQQNEWHTWFGEFHINLDRDAAELMQLFQDRTLPLHVDGRFVFSEEELQFIRDNADALLEERALREVAPDGATGGRRQTQSLAASQSTLRRDVDKLNSESQVLMQLLKAPAHRAALSIQPGGAPHVEDNILLELIFSTYRPQELGVVDYHGPHRNYNRERLGNIPLTIESSEQRLRQSALYNYANKYANLKSEMASAYIRHLLARQADSAAPLDDRLTATLKELFSTFFPGKQFLGPSPTKDGRLLFPVQLANGSEHDIDDLSSGEKEVLYGYLRLHNAAPRHSIILIDEPELHLNPRLVSGLCAFYYRHLGDRLGNQLWLVTHSDTLIREAVSLPHFAVFHIHPTSADSASQATPVRAQDELDRVVISLVGDLAAYRPEAKVVVFESTEDAAFDMRMTCTLFPEFEQRTNAISGGDKRRVADLYKVLERARHAGYLPGRFFAITDGDNDGREVPGTHYRWDVYHIENYLLEPEFVLAALRAIGIGAAKVPDEGAVLAGLRTCAEATMPALLAHKLRSFANQQLGSAMDLRIDPGRTDVGQAIIEAIAKSRVRFDERLASSLSPDAVAALEASERTEYEQALADGSWLAKFKGRSILRRFVGDTVSGMCYERFRDLIITRMSEAKHQPTGMANVVSAILAA